MVQTMNLESIMRTPRVGKFVADTFANVSFSLVVGGINDFFVTGLNLEETVKSRVINCAVAASIGRMYGLYRDGMWDFFGLNESSSPIAKTVADVAAGLTVNIPLYVSAIYLAGARDEQMVRGVMSCAGLVMLTARPYGAYMSYIRQRFVNDCSLEQHL